VPEKTLKESTFAKASVDEKVERAKAIAEEMTEFCLNEYMRAVELSDRGTWQMRHADCKVVEEALTALEEKVAELEKENYKLKNPVPGYITGQW